MSGERAIRRRLAFTDAIIQSLGEGVCALDAEGRFTYVNAVAARLLGWREGDLIGRQLAEILPAADASDYPAARLLEGVQSGEVTSVEGVFRRHDGTLLSVNVNSAPIVTAGDAGGTVVVFKDLTQQRDAEERLRAARRQAETLAALEQTKSEFLKVASHELRGPLAVLGGYLSMLEDRSLDDPHAVLTILQTKVQEMESLVEKMLETARLEEGRLLLKLEGIDLRQVAEAAVNGIRSLDPGSRPITLSVSRRPVSVLADRSRLEAILTGLLDNALKFSPEGGPVDVDVRVDGDWALVAVRDYGLGIAPDDMPHLFTRFGRPVTSRTSHLPGSGLGLYLAREIARMHGGDVQVDTLAGRGSTFTLLLPLTEPKRPRERRLLAGRARRNGTPGREVGAGRPAVRLNRAESKA